MPTITAFAKSPDGGRGLARDMRVRWALEEVGQPYDVRLLSFEQMRQREHLALQPFGQIPTLQDGELALFESGAIVLHIAEQHPGLLPHEPAARGRAVSWMFAAAATVEPVVVEREASLLLERDKPWFEDRAPLLADRVRRRLDQLSAHLGRAEWLDGAFSAGDLMMVSALQRPAAADLLDGELQAYVSRAKARPAFQRAFDAQYAVFLSAHGGCASTRRGALMPRFLDSHLPTGA